MDEYEGAWISTLYTPRFHFLEPVESEVDIRDIAHSLSGSNRFGAHGKYFYSVAEHSIHIAHILRVRKASVVTQLAGLLHDAEETYLPDIPKPVKLHMPEANKIYVKLREVIYKKFKVQDADWELIKDLDDRICTAEAKVLGIWNKDWAPTGKRLVVELGFWSPRIAEAYFLNGYETLSKEL